MYYFFFFVINAGNIFKLSVNDVFYPGLCYHFALKMRRKLPEVFARAFIMTHWALFGRSSTPLVVAAGSQTDTARYCVSVFHMIISLL